MIELLDRTLPSPFSMLLALVPLVGYLVVVAAIRLSGRSLITTGGRDVAALGLAIAGLVAIGPAELFFPTAAAIWFGPIVWIWLAALYALCVTLIAVTIRPRLVIYGRTPEEMFEPLLRAAKGLDEDAQSDVSKHEVHLPSLGVRLRVEGHRGIDHAQVVCFESATPAGFWQRLLAGLRREAAREPTPVPRRGAGMLVFATLMAALLLWRGIEQQAVVVEEFREWLWR